MPVLDPVRGRAKTGQLWAYAADDRPWTVPNRPGVAYLYSPDRKADRRIAHLAGFSGLLQVDGYAGYGKLGKRDDVGLRSADHICGATSTNLPPPVPRLLRASRSSISPSSMPSRRTSVEARPVSG